MTISQLRYSLISLARNALSRHERWPRAWRSPDPKPSYHVLIVGGGGHGLATAYWLAKNHGIRNVAVLERGPIGLGNTGRNTTAVRSNYLHDDSAHLYEHALKLWERPSRERMRIGNMNARRRRAPLGTPAASGRWSPRSRTPRFSSSPRSLEVLSSGV